MNIMKSGIFTSDLANVADAALVAVITAVVVAAVQMVTATGFDIFTADWVAIWHNTVNIGVIAGVVTIGNSFLSTKKGSLLGIGPETV